MAADLDIKEGILKPGEGPLGRVIHHYGPTFAVGEVPKGRRTLNLAPTRATRLDTIGQAGLSAFQLRNSPAYIEAKARRPFNGISWDVGSLANLKPEEKPYKKLLPPDLPDKIVRPRPPKATLKATPTSQRLKGKVAVGIVIVSGPDGLAFSAAEKTKVVAEVQNGLSWLGGMTGTVTPVQFFYDIQDVALDLPDDPDGGDKEGYWRDPTMQKLGYADPAAYVAALRTRMKTDWAYCAFFVKYSQSWFAYAYMGGPYLCMQYANDGWGPDNIDRVFAHETGHIFNAPDEYQGACNNCTDTFGMYSVVNGNCVTCAPGGGVDCIMKGNSWAMCPYTLWHLGCPDLTASFQSVAFPNVFLRMDGTGVTKMTGPGGGTVNCQYTAGPWEKFNLVLQKDSAGRNDGSVAIGSIAFPNVFLRMDGTGVTKMTGPGGGTVNCQYTVGPWEKFFLTPQSDGSLAVASIAFPNVFLRMDGTGVTKMTGPGGGTVNCQYTAGPWEKYRLAPT
jgi:hypothetical protein